MFPGTTAYGFFGGGGNSWPSFVMTYAEVALIEAEAANRSLGGLNPAQAAGFYNAGVTASILQWGGSAAEAAAFFDGRLPEAFGGYPRSMTKYPVQYPTACSPQAWSTGAPLLLLATILGLEPVGEHLLVDPALPSTIGRLEVLDIPGRWGRVDAFARGRVDTSAPVQRRRAR